MRHDGDAGKTGRLYETDVSSITEITNAAAEMYYGVLPERCYSRPYTTPEDVRRDIEEGVAYRGYFLDSELVGVIGVQEMDMSEPPTHDDGYLDGETVVAVRRLYVEPNHQRRGIGTFLLEDCLRRHPHSDVYTVTWKDATWAVEFYEKNGFENIGVQPDTVERYWSPPEGCEDEFVVLLLER